MSNPNPPNRRPVTAVADIRGLWRRSLIRWPDGRSDTRTAVSWLQTPSLFVDLRQPADRPSFDGVHCLRDLGRAHIHWLAAQEGFAGETLCDGHHVEWQRWIDFQPQSAFPDAGKLWFERDVMLEQGREVPYLEHWHREGAAAQPCGGIALRETTSGQAAMLVRAGDRFMYARARPTGLPPLSDLRGLVGDAPAADMMQDLIDCEISGGFVGIDGWRIEQSTLPFKERRWLQPITGHGSAIDGGAMLRTHDLSVDGKALERRWEITRVEGILADLLRISG